MSSLGGPNIITDGLVLYLDAANKKSLADVPATNLLKNSEQVQFWNLYQSTVSTNTTTAPDGTTTADTTIETSGLTGNRGVQQQLTGLTSGQTYTFSIYAKYNGRNIEMGVYQYPGYTNYYLAKFNLQTGTITSSANSGTGVRTDSSITNVGNGWYRCSVSGYIPGATQLQPNINFVNSSNTTSYTGDGVSGVYLWGGQLETGPTATTYIPTTSTIASRVPPWSDVSRKGSTGTLINGVAYDSQNGGSLVFDGVDDYVTTTYNSNVAFLNREPYTLEVFANSQNRSSYPGWIDREANLGSGRDGYNLLYTVQGIAAGNVFVFSERHTSGVQRSAGVVIPTSSFFENWNHIVSTYDGSILKFYLNGINRTTSTDVTGSLTNSTTALQIGRRSVDSSLGKLATSRIYNRALSAQEVLQNYNATKSRFNL